MRKSISWRGSPLYLGLSPESQLVFQKYAERIDTMIGKPLGTIGMIPVQEDLTPLVFVSLSLYYGNNQALFLEQHFVPDQKSRCCLIVPLENYAEFDTEVVGVDIAPVHQRLLVTERGEHVC